MTKLTNKSQNVCFVSFTDTPFSIRYLSRFLLLLHFHVYSEASCGYACLCRYIRNVTNYRNHSNLPLSVKCITLNQNLPNIRLENDPIGVWLKPSTTIQNIRVPKISHQRCLIIRFQSVTTKLNFSGIYRVLGFIS